MSVYAPTKNSKHKPNSAYLQRLIDEAEPWTDNMTIVDFKKKKFRMFDAATYQKAANAFADWILEPHGLKRSKMPVQIGIDMRLDFFKMPYRTDVYVPPWFFATPQVLKEFDPCFLDVVSRGVSIGKVAFTDDILIPRLTHPKSVNPWMSYTFSETLSLRPGIRAAKGHVLIGGMGMGWLAREVLRKPGVKSVTVVEIDNNIMDFFGTPLRLEGGEDKVKLVWDDAFAYAEKHGHKFDRILMDIWHEYGEQGDRQWRALVHKFAGTQTKLWQWA